MVAAKLSPIGVGNDILGSVRIPAGFNGVVGLLSSLRRLPLMDTVRYFLIYKVMKALLWLEWIPFKLSQVHFVPLLMESPFG